MRIPQFMTLKIPPNLPLLKGGTFSDQSLPDSPLLPARSTPLGAPLLRSDPASGQSGESSLTITYLIPHFAKGGLGGI